MDKLLTFEQSRSCDVRYYESKVVKNLVTGHSKFHYDAKK